MAGEGGGGNGTLRPDWVGVGERESYDVVDGMRLPKNSSVPKNSNRVLGGRYFIGVWETETKKRKRALLLSTHTSQANVVAYRRVCRYERARSNSVGFLRL